VALERLRVATDDAVAIGDSIERDLLGARNAGLRSIWVNRRAEIAPAELRPAIEIHTLNELPQALMHL
jgi:putative hydrolase of the HAD superfamily